MKYQIVEDLQGGISITDLTLDDYIMSLDRFMKENPNVLEKYPTGVYAVTDIPDKNKEECVEGVIYCLKQKKHTDSQELATSLYPYYFSVCKFRWFYSCKEYESKEDIRFI